MVGLDKLIWVTVVGLASWEKLNLVPEGDVTLEPEEKGELAAVSCKPPAEWDRNHSFASSCVRSWEVGAYLSDSVVFTLLVLTKGVRESSLEEVMRPVEELWLSPPPLLREMSMDSQLVCRLLTDWKPKPSLLTADELLALVPHVRLLEGPEWAELGLEARGDWFISTFLL